MSFDHITIRASERAASESFYDTVLRTVGVGRSERDEQYTVWGGDFSLAPADDRNRVTRRLHIGFVAPSRVHVDAFWEAGVDAGYRSDGEPGPRPEYSPDYYGGVPPCPGRKNGRGGCPPRAPPPRPPPPHPPSSPGPPPGAG